MRIPLRELSLLVLTALFTASCSSGSNSSPSSPSNSSSGSSGGSGSTVTALIDGVVWNPSQVTVTYHQTSNPYLEIDTVDASNSLFSFAFSRFLENGADLTPGTYAIGPTDTNANFVLVGGTTTWSAIPGVNGSPILGSGSVVLTAFSKSSKTASGTFNFVLTTANGSSTKTVTNGVFNVTFP